MNSENVAGYERPRGLKPTARGPKVGAMNDRRRILVTSILVMAGAVLCASAIAITILYHTAFEARRVQLTEIAGVQAHFIEAMARFDERHDQTTHPTGSILGDTTSVILDAYEHHPGFGETGEFVITRREGDRIIFLLPYRHGERRDPDSVPWQSHLAEPTHLALSGKSGTLVGLDYRGEPVLAAHEPVAALNFGVVAKIDLAEIRAPFVTAAMTTAGLTVALVVVGAGLLLRVSGPLIRRLADSESRTRVILETAAEGIITIDHKGVIDSFNPAATAIFGYKPEEVIGRNVSMLMPAEFSEGHDENIARYLRTNQAKIIGFGREVEGQRKGGTIFPLHIGISEMRLEDRRLFTGMVHDLTERKRAEQEAREAQQRLLEQQRSETERVQAELEKAREQLVTQIRLASIGQVAGSIAHDLRNPLGSARNAIYYIKRYVSGADPDLLEHLDIINEEISAADGIISDLMNMTRSKPLVREELDFGEVVRSAVHRAKLADGICCHVTLDPNPFRLNADPGQLRQVVQNLLSNAAQALDGQGRITVEAKRGKSCSEIEIRDNGCGVAAEHRDRLFEPLFTTKAKGTGLGLTICREIIRRHGGSIGLVDNGESGASFRIRLPL